VLEWAYRFLADLVLATHLVFVLFVLGGALLMLRWRSLVWLHVPALLWAILLKTRDLTCPLTPLEKWLRARAGETVYKTGFIDHYLLPLLQPASLEHQKQIALDTIVLSANALIYTLILVKCSRARMAKEGREP
jgi:hypothetical protein